MLALAARRARAPPPDPSDTVQRHGPRRRLHRRRARARSAQAMIPVTDEGLIRGDGAFEVIRLYGGRPYALDAHLARLERSAAGLRLPLEVDAVRADVDALLGAREPRRRPAARHGHARRASDRADRADAARSRRRSRSSRSPTRRRTCSTASSRSPTPRTCSPRGWRASRVPTTRCSSPRTAACSSARPRRSSSSATARSGRAAHRSRARLDHAPRRARASPRCARSRSTARRARGRRGGVRRLERARGRAACTASATREFQAPGRAHARARGARPRADRRPSCPDADRHGASATGRSSSRRPAVCGPLRARHEEVLIHTGQHHDSELSAVFFDELGLPAPDHDLGVAGGSNASQLARMLTRARAAARSARARTRCCSTATRTRRSRARWPRPTAACPVIHVEAGHALVRPLPAGGAQPRAHRPALGAAAVLERVARRRSSPRSAFPVARSSSAT